MSPAEIDELTADYHAGQSLHQLAQKFGIHRRTAAIHLERCGVPRRVNPRKLRQPDLVEAAHRYQSGDSFATIADMFGVHASTVRTELHRAGIAIRPPRGG